MKTIEIRKDEVGYFIRTDILISNECHGVLLDIDDKKSIRFRPQTLISPNQDTLTLIKNMTKRFEPRDYETLQFDLSIRPGRSVIFNRNNSKKIITEYGKIKNLVRESHIVTSLTSGGYYSHLAYSLTYQEFIDLIGPIIAGGRSKLEKQITTKQQVKLHDVVSDHDLKTLFFYSLILNTANLKIDWEGLP